MAELLRSYLQGKAPGQPVWGGTWASDRVAADMLRIDLEAAGIPYAVEEIDLRTLQELAGHSTPVLTARYSHHRLYDLAGAVAKLPNFLPDTAPAEALRATGTDGELPTGGVFSLRPACAPSEAGWDSVRSGEMEAALGGGKANRSQSPVLRGVESGCEQLILPESRAGDRIRTGDVQLGKLAFYH